MKSDKHIIGVVSGKGGVGKTTIAVNIASLLSLNDISTVLVDSDFYNPSIGFHLGMWHQPAGLQHLLDGKAKLEEVMAIYNPTGLRTILSSLNYFRDVKTENYTELMKRLNYDYIVIDSPPGLSETVEDVINVCNELYVVLTPDIPSITSAEKIVTIADGKDVKLTFLLNRVTNSKYELHPKEIERTLNSKIATTIPEDSSIPESISLRTPVVISRPNSPPAKKLEAFMKDTAKLTKTRGLPVKKGSGFFDFIKRLLGL